MLEGIIINTQKNKFRVKATNGIFLCDVKGSLIEGNKNNKNFLVTGDYVEFDEIGDNYGLIRSVKIRKSEFFRYENQTLKSQIHKKEFDFDPEKRQMIAANINQAIIVFSVKNPKYKTILIDRYMILLKQQNIKPIISFNKIDLIDYEDIRLDVENYQKKGIKTILTSSYTNQGISELKSLLKGKLSVFSGSSGVGKSSLINSIFGDNIAKTSEISSFTNKGKHTTTTSNIYDLDFESMVIDTPGMKGFDFYKNEKDINESFSDIVELATSCKFKNCQHKDDLDCAVKNALKNGEISENNYNSFIKLKSKGFEERKKSEFIAQMRRESVKKREKKKDDFSYL